MTEVFYFSDLQIKSFIRNFHCIVTEMETLAKEIFRITKRDGLLNR